MDKIYRAVVVALALIALALPALAYNNKPSGVAYDDPQFSTMYVTGAARVGGTLTLGSTALTASAAELNLLDGFSGLATKSLTLTRDVTINPNETLVATYSLSGLNASSTVLWGRYSAIATAASRSLIISAVRPSAVNEVEVTIVNASDSALVTPASVVWMLVVR